MFRKILFMMVLLSLLPIHAALAEDANQPRIVIMRPEADHSSERLQSTLLHALQGYGYLSAGDAAELLSTGEVSGENASVRLVLMPLDLPNINLLVEETLDWEPDAIIAISTEIAQSALNATLLMDDPPALIFAGVFSPYQAGIASASCIKPDHVTGIQSVTPFEDILPLFLAQMPDMQTIGTIFNTGSAPGSFGAERIRETGAQLGLEVREAAATSVADLRPATQSLLNEGVEAFVLPVDPIVDAGLPIIVAAATEYGIPVFHASTTAATIGATIGAGYFQLASHGVNAALILAGYLNGDLDIARTAIHSTEGFRVAVSLDSAAELGIEIVSELQEMAFATVSGGETDYSPEFLLLNLQALGMSMPEIREAIAGLEDNEEIQAGTATTRDVLFRQGLRSFASAEKLAKHAEFLQSLQCTDEMIAEQQAALDAAE